MPVAAARQRLKRLRHHFGIRAQRLEVRPRLAWYAYALGGALAAWALTGLVLALGQWFRAPEVRDVEQLRQRLAQLEAQVVQSGGALTSLEMTASANRQLSDELRVLADDHAVLKDDLAYFLRLVPAGARDGEVRLDRLVVRPDPAAPGRYRYSVYVGYQSGRQPQEFVGTLAFVLTVLREGKEVQLPWPPPRTAVDVQVRTRHWARKEGVLQLSPGERLLRAELRLMQGKAVRVSTSVGF